MFLMVCKKKMTTRSRNPDHDFAVIGWVHGVDWVFGFLFSFLRVFILLFFSPSSFFFFCCLLCVLLVQDLSLLVRFIKTSWLDGVFGFLIPSFLIEGVGCPFSFLYPW